MFDKKMIRKKINPHERRRSRHLALQGLYQWMMSRNALIDIEKQCRIDNDFLKVDGDYYHTLLHDIPAKCSLLDEAILPLLDRPMEQIDPVEKASLWIGCYELMYQQGVPYRVAINEAIELAKCFGAQDSHRYVNGILDKLAPKVREAEVLQFQSNQAKRNRK